MPVYLVPYVARAGGRIQQALVEANDPNEARALVEAGFPAAEQMAIGRPRLTDADSRRASLRWR